MKTLMESTRVSKTWNKVILVCPMLWRHLDVHLHGRTPEKKPEHLKPVFLKFLRLSRNNIVGLYFKCRDLEPTPTAQSFVDNYLQFINKQLKKVIKYLETYSLNTLRFLGISTGRLPFFPLYWNIAQKIFSLETFSYFKKCAWESISNVPELDEEVEDPLELTSKLKKVVIQDNKLLLTPSLYSALTKVLSEVSISK